MARVPGYDFELDPAVNWEEAIPPSSGNFPLQRKKERNEPTEAEIANNHNPTWIFNFPLPENHPALQRKQRNNERPQQPSLVEVLGTSAHRARAKRTGRAHLPIGLPPRQPESRTPPSIPVQARTPVQQHQAANVDTLYEAQRVAQMEELDALAQIAAEQRDDAANTTLPPIVSGQVTPAPSMEPVVLSVPSTPLPSEVVNVSAVQSPPRAAEPRRQAAYRLSAPFGTDLDTEPMRPAPRRRGPREDGAWEISDFSYEALLELGSNAVSTGLDAKQLARYKTTTQPKDSERADCTICLEEIHPGDQVMKLACQHVFHPQCIIAWLQRTNHCPTCRFEIPRK